MNFLNQGIIHFVILHVAVVFLILQCCSQGLKRNSLEKYYSDDSKPIFMQINGKPTSNGDEVTVNEKENNDISCTAVLYAKDCKSLDLTLEGSWNTPLKPGTTSIQRISENECNITVQLTLQFNEGQHQGKLTCRYLTSPSTTVQLNVNYATSLVVITTPELLISVEEGSTVDLQCKANGNPEPSYLWLFSSINTLPVYNLTRWKIVHQQPHYSFSARIGDTGVYLCAAQYQNGTKIASKQVAKVEVEDTRVKLTLISVTSAVCCIFILIFCGTLNYYFYKKGKLWFRVSSTLSLPSNKDSGPETNGDKDFISPKGTIEDTKEVSEATTFILADPPKKRQPTNDGSRKKFTDVLETPSLNTDSDSGAEVEHLSVEAQIETKPSSPEVTALDDIEGTLV